MFLYSQHHWLSLSPSPSPSPSSSSSPSSFGSPTLVVCSHQKQNQQQHQEIVREKYQREVLQTFMEQLLSLFKLKRRSEPSNINKEEGGGKGGEIDETKKEFDNLYPLAQYILLT